MVHLAGFATEERCVSLVIAGSAALRSDHIVGAGCGRQLIEIGGHEGHVAYGQPADGEHAGAVVVFSIVEGLIIRQSVGFVRNFGDDFFQVGFGARCQHCLLGAEHDSREIRIHARGGNSLVNQVATFEQLHSTGGSGIRDSVSNVFEHVAIFSPLKFHIFHHHKIAHILSGVGGQLFEGDGGEAQRVAHRGKLAEG